MATSTQQRLSRPERDYLASQRLARLATVDADGRPHNTPVGFSLRDDGTIVVGGIDLAATRKFRNVQATGRAALVVDDLVSVDPWRVRGVEIRGRAEALTDVEPIVEGMSRAQIRIHPGRVRSWGLAGSEQRS